MSNASRAAVGPAVGQDILTQYLISMTRTVELSMQKVFDVLSGKTALAPEKAVGEIFLLEPRINEMEMMIDEHAIRLLGKGLAPEEIRQVAATLKITNELERMGDMAVNLAERVLSLAGMPQVNQPAELQPMVEAAAAMVKKSLGALIFRNVTLASEVLESDDLVDRYRDQIFERLMMRMSETPLEVAPDLQLILVSRHLERLADHATNIAEDIIFWIRGLDVRHGRAQEGGTAGAMAKDVIDNS